MSQDSSLDKISKYYNELVAEYGHDPRSCDYGHANSQKIKFEVLSQALAYDSKSVLDIGCGFADYSNFLNSKFKAVDYCGVDISAKMIEEAKKLHPELKLELRNVFQNPYPTKFDVVTANGIFYLLGENSQALMQEFIIKMFAAANEVVVFNSLSAWAADKVAEEFYADPSETLSFCKTLSPWVTLRHDYHPRDFTIYLYKNKNA